MANKIKTFDAAIGWLMAVICTLSLLICAFCLVADAISDRHAGMYLGLHLMHDRQVDLATEMEDGDMIVLSPQVTEASAVVPQGGRAAALPPSPLSQGYHSMVKDHPLNISSATGPSGGFTAYGYLHPGNRALGKSTKQWNSGILGDSHE
ncbi:MAG: hypothetical protein KKD73_01760 [Proteobacteria bacterium]|nr:hypothetical protein [Pseudomonadota bacterium]MBU1640097.1 hypothetical protein [Pseudomonadota bacterium]